MSEMQFPPAGTMCIDCGCCQANVYAAGDPLCWACDAGNHGPKKEAPTPAPTTVVKTPPPCKESQAREEIRTPVVTPPAVEKPKPAKAKATQMEKRTMQRFKVSETLRAAIIAADPSISSQSLAVKHGVHYSTVWLIRKQAGIKPSRSSSGGRKSKAKPAPRAAIVRHTATAPAIEAPGCAVAITGQITPAGADKFWSILSLEQKSQIIQASLRSILTAEVV